jgi:hypothetical protein
MKSFSIILTEPQASMLLRLLDLAVKAGGLQVAADALALHDLVQAAYKLALTPESKINTV